VTSEATTYRRLTQGPPASDSEVQVVEYSSSSNTNVLSPE